MSPSNEPFATTKQLKTLNKDLNDVTYIPWPAPSHLRFTPDIHPWDSFVVSRDKILVITSLGGLTSDTGAIYAQFTSLSEAQSLYTVRRLLGKCVPVPEVYAFVHDSDLSFLYMELVQGVTLLKCWADLSEKAKMDVCAQLKPMMQALRELEQDPSDSFIGSISRQPPQDVMFEGRRNPGPLTSIAAFHDYFSNPRNLSSSPHPLRNMLRDNQQIYFTHGDINRANVIISPPSDGPVRIRAIIDWQQSGWYPTNWEYCKARWQTLDSDSEGWQHHLSEFLERWPTRGFGNGTISPCLFHDRLQVYTRTHNECSRSFLRVSTCCQPQDYKIIYKTR